MASRRLDLCSCPSSNDNLSDFPDLKEVLPSDYKYTVCNWTKVDTKHSESRFRVNVSTKAEVYHWLKEFSISTNIIFEKEALHTCEEAVIFAMRCEHATTEPPQRHDNVDFLLCKKNLCPTRLVIILKLPEFAKKHGDEDVHLHDFPMTVIFHEHHNHLLESPVNLKKEPLTSNEHILNSLAAVENKLMQENSTAASLKTENLFAEDNTEECSSSDAQTYHELLDSIFPANSTEEEDTFDFLLPSENQSFSYSVDLDSLVDYIISRYRANRSADESNRHWVHILPEYCYQSVQMEMLPHIPLQDIFDNSLNEILE